MPRESYDLTDHVVRTVDYQTGGPQPDRIAASKIVLILTDHGNEAPERVRASLDEAVADGRLKRDGESVWIPE